MAIGIDDLDDDDVMYENHDDSDQQYHNNPSEEGTDDVMSDFLKSRGISDIQKIKFEDENGSIEERSWNDLSKEEKLNILNTPLQDSSDKDYDLSDDEVNLLNQIRQSKLTPQQYIDQFKQEQPEQQPIYKIDDLSDDELFLLDLESRVGELSDDEAAQALSNAKQNEDFYKKQVDGIRKEYKEREDFSNQQQEAEQELQQQEAFKQYQDQVISTIDNFNAIGNLDLNLEDQDKEELAEFMLSQDENGYNYLYKALQEPENLVKAAWFILNGEEAFNNISDYFTNQIKLVSENQYKKGFEEGKNGTSSRPNVVIQKKQNQRPMQYNSINDLDDDD